MGRFNESTQAFESLKEYMITNYNAKTASGGKEILKRCHLCGDSRDSTSAHMYIGCKDGVILYNCFKCNASGVVDGRFLRDLGCYDPGIISICVEQNKKSSKSYNKIGGFSSRIPLIPLSNNEFAIKKLNYISNRMGCVFNSNDAAKFKIILNLKDFLYANNIKNYTRQPDIVDLLDKFFLGFLSIDNKYIVLRRLVPEGKLPKSIDRRYINYNIFGELDNGLKYYTIPNIINPTEPVEIHIAEGCFDILSIYLHVAPIGSNAVFGAVCGKSYMSLVRFFIVNYGFTNFDLHLYPDSDVSLDKMSSIKEDIKIFGSRVFVHRNTSPGQKDYGVDMHNIIDTVTKI